MAAGQEDGVPTFTQIDQNGDGQVSRSDWSDFNAQRFAEARKAGGGMMPEQDHDRWRASRDYSHGLVNNAGAGRGAGDAARDLRHPRLRGIVVHRSLQAARLSPG
jgi:hypothetical protein